MKDSDATRDYAVASDINLDRFANQVRELLKHGYRPKGGIVVAVSNRGEVFYQSMYRKGMKKVLEDREF